MSDEERRGGNGREDDRQQLEMAEEPCWRVGRSVGRTIYRDDELVGVMDTPELALEVVEALGGAIRCGTFEPMPPRPRCGACGTPTTRLAPEAFCPSCPSEATVARVEAQRCRALLRDALAALKSLMSEHEGHAHAYERDLCIRITDELKGRSPHG